MTTSLTGRTALVTGASSGLGADFARTLAARGAGLVLVARREQLLHALADELRDRYRARIEVIALDLIAPDATETLHERTEGAGRPVDVLVNNAGFGLFGEFLQIPWERERRMLKLDVVVPVHLTKMFLPAMVARDFGHVLNIASIGAYQPSPLYASYSAAKSFILNFTEAIGYELRDTKVRCTVLAPGVTATEFLAVAGQEPTRYQRLAMMRSADVARIGVDAMLKGRASVVPGRLNAITAWSTRLLPRRASTAIARRLMT